MFAAIPGLSSTPIRVILASSLEKNSSMKKSIKNNAENGTPIYAECGGLMYLTNSITYGHKKS